MNVTQAEDGPGEECDTEDASKALEPGTSSAEEPSQTAATTIADSNATPPGVAGVTRIGYAAISRVDTARREVELCATSEAVDSYGTIFDYAASKDAFTRWIGNVREMHERRAVGSRVGLRCDEDEHKIFVRVRISRGAQDTWEKICDGTLRGASIGAANVVWERQARPAPGGQRLLKVATRYDLAELSLVDNPSNPDALGLCIVRDAMPDTSLLDVLDPLESLDADVTSPRDPLADAAGGNQANATEMGRGFPVPQGAGARPTSLLGQGPAGNARERLHGAARGILLGCGCVRCATALAALGDDDAGMGADAPRAAAGAGSEGGEGGEADDGTEAQRTLARVTAAGLAASAALAERIDGGMVRLERQVAEHLGTLTDQFATLGGLARHLDAGMTAIGERVEALEAQPLPGGPVARPVGRPVEKTHALTPGGDAGQERAGAPAAEQFRALEALAGRLRDPQAQMAVAAELIRLQRGGG